MKLELSHHQCSNCVMGRYCLPLGLSSKESELIDQLVEKKIKLEKGEMLYSQGESFHSIFSIRYGSVKSEYSLPDGCVQILNFHLPGEIIGLDGIGKNQYESDCTALENTEVCVLDFNKFEDLAKEIPTLQKHLHQILSREITQDQKHLLTLGHLNADQKLAYFLINLAERLKEREQHFLDLHLSMSREEMGSYLGIKIETVSRTLSKLIESKCIEVNQRHIKIIDLQKLYQLAGKDIPLFMH